MYQTGRNSWIKHGDFIFLDLICMQAAFLLAYAIRHHGHFAYASDDYLHLAVFIVLIQTAFGLFSNQYKNILRRGSFREFVQILILFSTVILVSLAFLFLVKASDIYSRIVLLTTWVLAIVLVYVERSLWKQVIRRRMRNRNRLERLVIICRCKDARKIVGQLENFKYKDFYISGILLLEGKKEEICGFPVAAVGEDIILYLQKSVVDRVFISAEMEDDLVQRVFDLCRAQGNTVHYNVSELFHTGDIPIVDSFCGQSVVTYSVRHADSVQLLAKRLIDLAGGIVGLLLTGISTIILAPIIYLQNPGPIFFAQERVGRNGRRFTIYKFRSMYPDAEQRLQELMDRNKLSGPMVKIENDPRIIPIGHFIRRTSLDEFPQFWNVLKGEMSLVGTRPPTVAEYEQYEPQHKVRLAFKPGLTGLWQVSGRSSILDFEDVLKLDRRYIDTWSIGLDISILLKTVKVIFTGSGAE